MWQLNHPHIVRVFDPKGEDAPYLYFVMEYVPNGTLEAAILKGSIEINTGFELLVQIAEALHYAHNHRFVHRDVKASNILIDSNVQSKLSDFDLVMAEDTTGGTQVGQMGSVAFCAPEMITRPFEADARADVFSLGRVAVFILQGKDYFWPGLMNDSRNYIRVLNCSEWLKAFLLTALEEHPRNRFQTAAQFSHDLRKLIDNNHLRRSPGKQVQTTKRPTWSFEGLDDAT
jgi:eukaryotic-like serine/threonine-protein kinase